jgi:hypothetical protein
MNTDVICFLFVFIAIVAAKPLKYYETEDTHIIGAAQQADNVNGLYFLQFILLTHLLDFNNKVTFFIKVGL